MGIEGRGKEGCLAEEGFQWDIEKETVRNKGEWGGRERIVGGKKEVPATTWQRGPDSAATEKKPT